MSTAQLTGTAKQAAWATTIRTALLAELAQWEEQYAKPEYPNYTLRQRKARLATAFLAAQSDARWFIDHRDASAQALINWLDDEGLFDGAE